MEGIADDDHVEEIVCDRKHHVTTTSEMREGEILCADLTEDRDVALEMDPQVMDTSKDLSLDTLHVPDDGPVVDGEHGDDKLQDNRCESQDNRGESQDNRGESQDNRGESQDNTGESQDKEIVMTRHAGVDVIDDDDVARIISNETKEDDNDNKKENSTSVVEILLFTPLVIDEGREEDVHYPKDDITCQYNKGVGSLSSRNNTKLIPNDFIEYLDRMKQENEELKLRLAGKEYELDMLKKLNNASSEIIAKKEKELYFLQSDLEMMRCNMSKDQNKDIKIKEIQEHLANVVQASREKDEKISQLEDEIQNLRSVGLEQGNPHTSLEPRLTGQSSQELSKDLMMKSKTCTVM